MQKIMSTAVAVLAMFGTGCEAFKVQDQGIMDTGMNIPNPEPTNDPSNEPSSPTNEPNSPSNEPGSDTDTSDPNAIDCSIVPTPEQYPNMFECATAMLQRDVPVLGTTQYGTDYFTDAHYADGEWTCVAIPRGDYSSTERVYLFTHPGQDKRCDLYLESPCGDLDLFAVRYNPYTHSPPTCPDPNELNVQCEVSTHAGPGFDEEIRNLYENNQNMYLVIVDAPSPTNAWFRLTATCN